MGKRTLFTTITPLPAKIPRQLAIDMLHNHTEMIELNPLVIEHHPIKAPKNAAADEFFAVWHELTDKVQYMPGVSSKVSYKGVFHDMPWGLQTHIYAPLGLDIRDKWQIRGNQPGEPREHRELGDKAPHDGLYLREDIDMTCNIVMTGFVRKTLEKAHAVLVERLMKKAELIDAGTLQAMMENGRLKTVNPAVRESFQSHGPSTSFDRRSSMAPSISNSIQQQQYQQQQQQEVQQHQQQVPISPGLVSPQMMSPQQSTFYDPMKAIHPAYRSSEEDRRQNVYQLPPYQDPSQGQPYRDDMAKNSSAYARQAQYAGHPPRSFAAELPGSTYHSAQGSPNLAPPPGKPRDSFVSEMSASTSTHRAFPSPNLYDSSDRSSVSSGQRDQHGMPSPGLPSERYSVVSELATTPPMQSQSRFQRVDRYG